MAGEQIQGASEAPAVKPLETLLERVTENGKIDKQELQDIISRMHLEKADLQDATQVALNKLKSEGLHDILKNGLTLKQRDELIMAELHKNYTLSPQVAINYSKLGPNESFLITSSDGKTVNVGGMLDIALDAFSKDKADIRDKKPESGKLEAKAGKTPESIMVDVKESEAQKKTAIDAFKGKSLEEMISSNDTNITDTMNKLQDRHDKFGVPSEDIIKIKSINKLISRYTEVQNLAKNMRKASKSETETHNKENEIGLYQNNLYKLNQEANDFLMKTGEKVVAPAVAEVSSVEVVRPTEQRESTEVDPFTKIAEALKTRSNTTKQVQNTADMIQSALVGVPNKVEVKDSITLLLDSSKTNKDFQKSLNVNDDGTIGRLTINALFAKAGVIEKDLPEQKPKADKKEASGIQKGVDKSTASKVNTEVKSVDLKTKVVNKKQTPADADGGVKIAVRYQEGSKEKASETVLTAKEVKDKIKHGSDINPIHVQQLDNGNYKLEVSYKTKTLGAIYDMIPKVEIILTPDEVKNGMTRKSVEFGALTAFTKDRYNPILGKTYDIVLNKDGILTLEEPKK